jgi:hypothetical protein
MRQDSTASGASAPSATTPAEQALSAVSMARTRKRSSPSGRRMIVPE